VAALLVVAAVVVAGVLAVFAVGAVLRWRGADPGWARAWRHSWREAGYRTGGTWAEFRDWIRSGS
jgi:hypothetical protein